MDTKHKTKIGCVRGGLLWCVGFGKYQPVTQQKGKSYKPFSVVCIWM